MNHSIRLLHLEDDPRDAELIRLKLNAESLSCDIMWVNGKEAFESALDRETFDVVLSDYNLRDYDGMSALRRVREKQPELPVIVISGTLGEEEAVECLKAGATDYVLKQRLQRLGAAVRRALAEKAEWEKRLAVENALQASEERFRSIAEATHEWIWELDARGIHTFCSSAVEAILGYMPEELIGQSALDYVYHPAKDDGADPLRSAVAERCGWRGLLLCMRHKDGSMRWVDSNSMPLLDPQGEMIGYRGVTRDITERKEQEQKIARLSRIHAMLSGINSLIVRVKDRQILFDEACRICVQHGGFGAVWIGTLDGHTLDIVPCAWCGMDADELVRTLTIATTNKSTRAEHSETLIAVTKKRAVFVNDLRSSAHLGGTWRKTAIERGYQSYIVLPLITENHVMGVLGLFAKEPDFFTDDELKLLTDLANDISFALNHIKRGEQVDYLAYYDALTELPNRTLLHDRLTRAVRDARQNDSKLALLLLDIRRFRLINETLGRHAGDAILRELALRLKRIWPEPDNLARISGDWFAGILSGIKDASEIAHLLEEPLAEGVRPPFLVGDKEIGVSLTVGVAVFPSDGEDADTLLKNAEAALKKAKGSAEKYLFYHSKMNAAVTQTLLMENKLRRALDKEEFVLHYQPKLDLAKGHISGLEALIRWNDPETGLVPPIQFIPLLEETGMIRDVGAWVIRKALADYREWYTQGLQPPRIAVNVSMVQLRQKNFVDVVSEAIKKSQAMPGGLDLEITESLIMNDVEGSIKKLTELRAMEINIAVDDFGTGYSSLGYLARLPVNALKIDRSFINTMTESADSIAIITTIIALAHSLNMKVIAEGVETEEQSRLLKLFKCDEIQGYLFSKPLPMEQMTKMLEERGKG